MPKIEANDSDEKYLIRVERNNEKRALHPGATINRMTKQPWQSTKSPQESDSSLIN